jgi:hypothetical protein
LPGVAILGDASESGAAEVSDVAALESLLVRMDYYLLLSFALQDLDQLAPFFQY